MPTVQNTVTDAAGNPVAGAVVKIDLIAGSVLAQPGYTASTTIGPSLLLNADATGHWSVTLAGNTTLTPANTYYRIIEAGFVSYATVPASGGPYNLPSILVAPATPASPAITGVQVAADGVVAGVRPGVNLVSGANVLVTAADNPGSGRVDVTITGSGAGGGGVPSGTVVSETSYGQSAAAGAATSYSRGDHTHGSPALTAATPAAETPGAVGAVGTATAPARADHVHALPAYGTTAGTFAQGNDSRIAGALQAANNLSDVANAGTARGNLAAAPLASPTFTGTATAPRLILPPVALTDAATVATDASLGNHFRVTLGGNRTLGNPTNPTDGQRVIWELIQDATGSRTITLDTAFKLGTDITAVTLTTTASKRDFLGAFYNAATTSWYITAFIKGY